ncbi:MAG: EMC3/TMCO1 family protein [Candidatus Methanomethylophilus sp.]|nr:EMC3/TMCO1 family protein [Methanomethylophilus sp.]
MQQDMPQMPKGTMLAMMFTLLIMMVVVQFRSAIGEALDVVFSVIDFDGKYPVLTLVLGGLIMITLSTTIRAALSHPIEQAKNQHIQSEFNSELRKARLENNLYKMKKLTEEQPKIMAGSMQQSTDMMKVMPITMLVVIPIYAWVWFFVNNTVPDDLIDIVMPWGTANLLDYIWFMPIWIIVYTLISLPIGQLENKAVTYILLKRRLRQMESEE